MKIREWEASVNNQLIKVRYKAPGFYKVSSYELEIDGEIIRQGELTSRHWCGRMKTSYTFTDKSREIDVRITAKGCQILVDGDLIAGDAKLKYPDPEKARRQVEQGPFHFFIVVALIRMGLPLAMLVTLASLNLPFTSLYEYSLTDKETLHYLIEHTLIFSIIIGYFQWHNTKHVALDS